VKHFKTLGEVLQWEKPFFEPKSRSKRKDIHLKKTKQGGKKKSSEEENLNPGT